ncbi:glycoside hydrolase [Mycena amicta]|nr:glycoside hydrolase [Mycena amicta]
MTILPFLASLFAISAPSVLAATLSATPAQTFTGIGGSGAWWPHDVFNFPDTVRQNLSTLLFSQSGLGLTSYRFNIGGGGVGGNRPGPRPADILHPQGVFFMQQAAAHGVAVTAFVNSAPAALTSNKQSCGGLFVNGTGVAYGTYVADVIAHWRSAGVPISFISPMNEPDNSFGGCGQEGMQVSANQRAEVVNGIFSGLQAHGLTGTVGILADESSSLSLATSEYSTWLPSVASKVAAIVHHTYDFPSDASYTSFVNTVKSIAPGKPTWMSEVCCSLGTPSGTGKGYTQGFDPTITNALMFSGMVFQSLVLAGEPHYDVRQLGCSPLNNPSCATTANSAGWNDGMIYYDGAYATNKNFNLYVTKHFWTYKHFGNFVKPGSVRQPLTGTDVREWMLAVSTPTSYNLILMNPNTTDTTLSLTFPAGETVCATAAVRTSASEDFSSIAVAVRSGTAWSLLLRATSLSTYSFGRGSAC